MDIESEAAKETIMKNYLAVFGKKDVWSDLDAIMVFFNENLTKHFVREEVLINLLVKNIALEQVKIVELLKIVNEHKQLMKDFKELKELFTKIRGGFLEDSNKFVKNCFSVTTALVAHAKNEDEVLYPLASEKLNTCDINPPTSVGGQIQHLDSSAGNADDVAVGRVIKGASGSCRRGSTNIDDIRELEIELLKVID